MATDAEQRFAQLELYDTPQPLEAATYSVGNGYESLDAAIANHPALLADVQLQPLFLADGSQVESHSATVRRYPDGKREHLGVVGSRYNVIQDKRLVDLVRPVEDMFSSWNVGTAKARSWIQGNGQWKADITQGDTIEARVLAGNSHGGECPLVLGFPGNRVVCQNAFQLALTNQLSRLLRISHTATADQRITQVQTAVEMFGYEFIQAADKMKHLAQVRITDEQLNDYTTYVFRPSKWASTEEQEEELHGKTQKLYNTIQANFESGPGAEYARGTAWGAFNAATQYVTHQRGRLKDDARTADLQWGAGKNLLARAWEGAEELFA